MIVFLLNHPIWKHEEYATDEDTVRELLHSLQSGDVIQINRTKQPYRVHNRHQNRITLSPEYQSGDIEITGLNASDEALLFRERNRTTELERLGVIYRDDGSVSRYTEADLNSLCRTPDRNEFVSSNRKYEVTWVTDAVVPLTGRYDFDEANLPVPTRQNNHHTYDDHQLSEEHYPYHFEMITERVSGITPPEDQRWHLPGTLYFRLADTGHIQIDARRLVPIDQIKSISPLPKNGSESIADFVSDRG